MSTAAVREAMERTSNALSADPAKARVKAAATARLGDGLKCEVTGGREFRVATDMPPAMGGQASAPNPGWLMRAAMASCTATAIAMRAAKLRVVLSKLEVTVESEADQRGLLGMDDKVSSALAGWRTKVSIAGDAPPEKLREVVAWADAHSPVGCTLRQGAPSALEIELAQ
jgi:uncharacterized OsmC-like protein